MRRNYGLKKNFKLDARLIIEHANQICEEYQAQGYELTLRQLYYQFVSRDLIANKDTEYKRLGSIINDARMAGLLDWDFIVDRTRNVRENTHWNSPADIIKAAVNSYRRNLWEGQPTRVEVWIEKDALIGVIERVCRDYDVPHFSCRGYVSQSEMWARAQAMGEWVEEGVRPVVFHLGDHDPSGIDMTRDIAKRLNVFVAVDYLHKNINGIDDLMEENEDLTRRQALYLHMGEHLHVDHDELMDEGVVKVVRLGLTMDQVRQYDPPPNPAKLTDVRSTDYIELYGPSSWELDALEPSVINQLIADAVSDVVDDEIWEEQVEKQEAERAHLRSLIGGKT